MALDLTTIILTYNEELHIRRCLENVCPISRKVFIIDSPSNDRTKDICLELRAESLEKYGCDIEFVVHKYPGNQAEQYNWAIDNLPIETAWTMRVDADEYLLPELIEELKEKLPNMPADVTGIELKRRHIFMGKWVKHGVYPVIMLRICRTGCGRYAPRLMDEHYEITSGRSVVFENDFCDHSLISISDYCRKHIGYAQREAVEIMNELYGLSTVSQAEKQQGLGAQAMDKQKKKSTYNKLPLFWRSFAYFCYRYFLKGGFLDGKEGFLFAFIQGWWYRTMVDAKILEVRKYMESLELKADSLEFKEELKKYIKENWNISL